MISLYNKIVEHIEATENPAAIFCDLRRAFDLITMKFNWLYSTEKVGISGEGIVWITSFLEHRKQFAFNQSIRNRVIQSVNSTSLNWTIEVPQGSILGPILSILYTNNINVMIQNGRCVISVDDFSVIIASRDTESCQIFLDSVSLFFDANKTEVVRFYNRLNYPPDTSLKLNAFIGVYS